MLDRGIERDRVQGAVLVEVRRGDRTAERLARVLGQQARVAGQPRLVADRFDDRAEVADRDALGQQRLQHPLDLAEREHVGHDLVDDRLVGALELIQQLAHILAREQLGGVARGSSRSGG